MLKEGLTGSFNHQIFYLTRGSRFNPVLDMLASFKKGVIGGVKVHVDRLQVRESRKPKRLLKRRVRNGKCEDALYWVNNCAKAARFQFFMNENATFFNQNSIGVQILGKGFRIKYWTWGMKSFYSCDDSEFSSPKKCPQGPLNAL